VGEIEHIERQFRGAEFLIMASGAVAFDERLICISGVRRLFIGVLRRCTQGGRRPGSEQ